MKPKIIARKESQNSQSQDKILSVQIIGHEDIQFHNKKFF